MIAVGFLLIVVGFAVMAPPSSGSRSTIPRSVAIGWWRTPSTEDRGDESTPSWRSRIIQIVVGLLLIGGGIVLVAMST